ncbi:hypothetical protein [Fulvivirga imtechensis]|nr:hypothetical protein [Fulvivirga imtechensis]
MMHSGWFLKNLGDTFSTVPQRADLLFWGEWEPQSRFELTGNPFDSKLPHAIHYPIFSQRGQGRHNTDPFVFGEHFYYTNCKQKRTGKGKMLLNLQAGSVILFGSEMDKRHFVLDTVFVVNSSETVADYRNHKEEYNDMLRQATIDLGSGLAPWKKLYKGEMYDFNRHYSDDSPYIFSFFPCKIDCGKTGFERPKLDITKFKLQKPGAGTVLYAIDDEASNFWHELLAFLINQGYSLGIKLDMPQNNDAIEFPEYLMKDSNCGMGC